MRVSDNPYQWNPADYAGHSSDQLAWADELIEKLHLRGWEKVLDVGCGNGRVTSRIARRLTQGGRVLGVDASEAMLHIATHQYPPSKYVNLSFQKMDACDLTWIGLSRHRLARIRQQLSLLLGDPPAL